MNSEIAGYANQPEFDATRSEPEFGQPEHDPNSNSGDTGWPEPEFSQPIPEKSNGFGFGSTSRIDFAGSIYDARTPMSSTTLGDMICLPLVLGIQ